MIHVKKIIVESLQKVMFCMARPDPPPCINILSFASRTHLLLFEAMLNSIVHLTNIRILQKLYRVIALFPFWKQ
jgi:hypothetical protein